MLGEKDGAHYCAHSSHGAAQLLSTVAIEQHDTAGTGPKWEDCLPAQGLFLLWFSRGHSLSSGEEHGEAGVS